MKEAEFWILHDAVDRIHSEGTVQLLEKYLPGETERRQALLVAEDSMIAWKFYPDGICEAAIEKGTKARV
jgi:hypothetical protein